MRSPNEVFDTYCVRARSMYGVHSLHALSIRRHNISFTIILFEGKPLVCDMINTSLTHGLNSPPYQRTAEYC
jgi:hypothetical protein